MLSDSLLKFYADCFHGGNKTAAKYQLNAQHNRIRARDSNVIAFSIGAMFMMLCIMIFFRFAPDSNGDDSTGWLSFFAGEDSFIFLFVLIWVVFGTAANIYVFRSFGINYTFIFEIDQNYKLIHHQLARVGMILLCIWGIFLTFSIVMIDIDVTSPTKLQICTISMLVAFALICFCPLHCFYMRTRKQIAKTLWNILISPFGLVRFRHFFLADVITSMITPLQFIGVIYCFYLGP